MVRYDTETALLVVDMQNDFAARGGSLAVRGALETLPLLNGEIEIAAEMGALVLYTKDSHPPVTPHFAKDGGIWPVHCVAGSWGAEFVEGMTVLGPTLKKGEHGEDGYSAFSVRDPLDGESHPTILDELLHERGIRKLVAAGLATDYCVRETAFDAIAAGYQLTVLEDCVRAVDLKPGDGARALSEIAKRGARIATC